MIIAIDPGLTGGIVAFRDDNTIDAIPMPYDYERNFNNTIATIIENNNNVHFVIENVHSMPNQGVASTFTFGKHFGFICAIARIYSSDNGRIALVNPLKWKQYFGLPGKTKQTQATLKKIMYDIMRDIDPSCPLLYTKTHMGIMDAWFIGKYYVFTRGTHAIIT